MWMWPLLYVGMKGGRVYGLRFSTFFFHEICMSFSILHPSFFSFLHTRNWTKFVMEWSRLYEMEYFTFPPTLNISNKLGIMAWPHLNQNLLENLDFIGKRMEAKVPTTSTVLLLMCMKYKYILALKLVVIITTGSLLRKMEGPGMLYKVK